MHLTISSARTNLRRTLFVALGIVSTVVGVIGILVPGLPGTVFVIAASQLFARSSPALDGWLRHNRWLGPSLRHFAEAGGATRSAQAFALVSIWSELALGWYVLAGLGSIVLVLAIALGVLATAALFLITRATPATDRHPLTSGRYRIAPDGRLHVEPGLVICVTSS